MKKWFLILGTIIGVFIGSISVSAADAADVFADVSQGSWYYEYVSYVYEHGYMTGMNESVFDPAGNLNRAQFVTILYRVAGNPEVDNATRFPDVPEGQFYTDAVAWASSDEIGVVYGYDDGRFGPTDDITREQMAVMLRRYAALSYDVSDRGDLNSFSDGQSVSGFADEAMRWTIAAEIISGNSDGTLAPQGMTSRAAAAAMLQRFLNYCEQGGLVNKPYYDYYREKLVDIYHNPEDYIDDYGWFGELEANNFTIRDIDQDGIDDLLFQITNSTSAGMHTKVWTYNESTQSIQSMGQLGVGCDFYYNGIIKANLPLKYVTGEFLPYNLARYDHDTKELNWFATARSVEREWDAKGEYSPADDADGDGVIYYFYNFDEQPSPLTFAQYQERVQEVIPDNQKMSMAWKTMEWCNISKVGNGEGE